MCKEDEDDLNITKMWISVQIYLEDMITIIESLIFRIIIFHVFMIMSQAKTQGHQMVFQNKIFLTLEVWTELIKGTQQQENEIAPKCTLSTKLYKVIEIIYIM